MNQQRVLILTGFSPIRLPQLEEMGIAFEPLPVLLSMSGKDTFRFSIPPIGGAVIASYLKQRGIEAEIADFYFDDIPSFDADIVGISSTFMGIEDVKRIADLVREQNANAKIVLGGPLSWSIPPARLLQMVPGLDYIVQREGEETFYQLIGQIRDGGDPRPVEGLVFRREGNIVETPSRLPLDFERLPLPAWELMGIPSGKRIPVLPVETSRGCPYYCAYCSEVSYWGRPVRYRSSDRVVAELRYDVEQLGITTFRFTDSCFSSPPDRCAAVCDAIYDNCVKHNIPIKWSSYARIEDLGPPLLDKMKRCGCVALDFGLESGSDTVLHKMGRGYSPEDVVRVARAAREADIITNFNVVVGFPGETGETVLATAALIDEAAPDTFACFVFFLAPNTRAYAQRSKFGLVGEGLSWQHETMTSEEAKEAMLTITRQVSNSVSFPAGEHFACYLTSLGYSSREIRTFYQAAGRLTRSPGDEAALSVVRAVSQSLGKFS